MLQIFLSTNTNRLCLHRPCMSLEEYLLMTDSRPLKDIANDMKSKTTAILTTTFCWQDTSAHRVWDHMFTFKVTTQTLGPHPHSLLWAK